MKEAEAISCHDAGRKIYKKKRGPLVFFDATSEPPVARKVVGLPRQTSHRTPRGRGIGTGPMMGHGASHRLLCLAVGHLCCFAAGSLKIRHGLISLIERGVLVGPGGTPESQTNRRSAGK